MGMSATLISPPYYKPCMQEERQSLVYKLHLRSVFTLCCLDCIAMRRHLLFNV